MSSGVSVILLAVQLALDLTDPSLRGDERFDVMSVSGDTSSYQVDVNLINEFFDSLMESVNGKVGDRLGARKSTVYTSLMAGKAAAKFDANQSLSVVNNANTGADGNMYCWMYYFKRSGNYVMCQTISAGFRVTLGQPYVIVHNHKENVFGSTEWDEKLDLPAVVTVRAATVELSLALKPMVTNPETAGTPILKGLIEGAKALPKDAMKDVDSLDESRSVQAREAYGDLEPPVIQLSGSYTTPRTNTEWEFAYY